MNVYVYLHISVYCTFEINILYQVGTCTEKNKVETYWFELWKLEYCSEQVIWHVMKS